MSLLFLEGFDAYGTTDGVAPVGILRKWTLGTAGGTVRAGRISGKSLRLGTNGTIGFNLPTGMQTLIAGFAFRVADRNSSESKVLEFFDGATLGVNLRQQTTGEWSVYRGSTHLATSAGNATDLGGWAYVELRVKVDNSIGEYELRVNGLTVLSATGVDTQGGANAWTDRFHLTVSGANASPFDFDDFYLLDETGAANNTFKGSVKVQTLFPTSDVSASNTPSTGVNNFAMVDDNPSDDDSTYVEGGATAADVYGYGEPTNLSVVHGLMTNTVCRETDATPFNIAPKVNTGTGTPTAIGSSTYVHRGEIFETNPDTGLAWTPAEIAAAEIGFQVSE